MRGGLASDGPPGLPLKTIAAWSLRRRAALARLHADPRVDPGDLAEATGIAAVRAEALFAHLGFPPKHQSQRQSSDPDATTGGEPCGGRWQPDDARVLKARLRLHVGRQIAAFDAALEGTGSAILDSARVLRDLGGLKRLLDDLARDGEREGEDVGEPDLPALRAEIARRAGRFVEAGRTA